MKKIALILAISVLLIGCDADVNTDTVDAENKNQLIITGDATKFSESLRAYIITDTETDQEYIVVKYTSAGGGVAITPRLKPETVLKERE